MAGSPLHVRDIVAAGLAGTFGDAFLAFLGLRLPSIHGVVATALKAVEFIDLEVDYVFELSVGGYLHLEFQDRSAVSELRRFLLYDALLMRQYEASVRTVVVYTGRVRRAPDVLDGVSIVYRVQNVYLTEYDGEAALLEMRARVESGEKLSRQDAVRLALLPLMRLGSLSVEAAAAEALHLVRGLGPLREQAVLAGTIIGLSGRFLAEDAVGRLIAVARTTTPFDDLLAKAFAEGEARVRHGGDLRKAPRCFCACCGRALVTQGPLWSRAFCGSPRPSVSRPGWTSHSMRRILRSSPRGLPTRPERGPVRAARGGSRDLLPPWGGADRGGADHDPVR